MAKKPIKKLRRRVPKTSLFQRLRNNFLTGLVVVAPVFLTIYLVWVFIAFVDDRVLPWVPQSWNPENILNRNIPGIGLVFFLLATTAIGYMTKGLFGRQIVRYAERLVDRTPVVRSIYTAVKQIIETIFSQSQQSFQNACLVEYPRRGLWALAFISTEARGELRQKLDSDTMLSIFLPTTPNPTSGFLLFVPRKDVVILDMSVEEAAKLVISAGLVVPPTPEEIRAGRKPVPAKSNGKTPPRPAA